MKRFIIHFEKYLLITGRFKLYFGAWIRNKYREDVVKLLRHYVLYKEIKEGLCPYHTFDVMNIAHGWDFDYYYRITLVMFYLDLLKEVPTKSSGRGTLNHLRTIYPSMAESTKYLFG